MATDRNRMVGIVVRVLLLTVALAGLGFAIVRYRDHLSEEEANRTAPPPPEPEVKGKGKGVLFLPAPPPEPKKQ